MYCYIVNSHNIYCYIVHSHNILLYYWGLQLNITIQKSPKIYFLHNILQYIVIFYFGNIFFPRPISPIHGIKLIWICVLLMEMSCISVALVDNFWQDAPVISFMNESILLSTVTYEIHAIRMFGTEDCQCNVQLKQDIHAKKMFLVKCAYTQYHLVRLTLSWTYSLIKDCFDSYQASELLDLFFTEYYTSNVVNK